MTWQGSFRVIIRVIFIFAYIAFLAASIRHVATFFHNFEADPSDWVNPYTLAVSIDLTSLVLTVGVMFFRKNMPWYAQLFTWVFIVALTAFSWFVNWEYALTYQGNALHVNNTLRMLNPILASSFAFLNLAYSVVAEFFSSKTESAAELAAKVDELEQLEEQQRRLAAYRERTKNLSVIQRVKNTALEARAAVNEVLTTEPVVDQVALVTNTTTTATTSTTSPTSITSTVEEELLTQAAIAEEVPAPVMVAEPQVSMQSLNTVPLSLQDDEPAAVIPVSSEEIPAQTAPRAEEQQQQQQQQQQKIVTEPLLMDAVQSMSAHSLYHMTLHTDEKSSEESDVALPAWAGGEDIDTFLTMEEMQPEVQTSDTASMSKISSATGKLTRRKPMTVPEVAEVLTLSERRIRALRSQGILVTDESNKIKVASVNAYLGKRKVKTE
ncbi:hypothetical protein ccbrp13_47400 [Ktedonobacteria bacterium brp13]|nr:hypothetical protein ccbrp13_47400 [Ktedonobacteria bacterium brp13]